MTLSLLASPAAMMPRAIAEPILPAPMMPIFSCNTGDLLRRRTGARQHNPSQLELQSGALIK
jgi:hypothetical protein